MFRTKAFIFLLLICLSVLLYAQEQETEQEEEDPIVQPGRDFSVFRPVPGDQSIIMSAGTIFPVLFINDAEVMENNFDPVGGNLHLSYSYFLTPGIFVGGEVSFVFVSTIGRNTVYFVPLGVKAGYQLNIWRLEFPISLTVGMIWHRYLDFGYYGLYLKAGLAGYFRFNEDWSFGINSAWGWYPQWINEENSKNAEGMIINKNVDGFIIDLTLSVRYHF